MLFMIEEYIKQMNPGYLPGLLIHVSSDSKAGRQYSENSGPDESTFVRIYVYSDMYAS